MSSTMASNIGEIYEQPLSRDNPGYDNLELDPTTMTSRKPDNEMGPTKTPTQRTDVTDSSNQVGSDKIIQLVETIASLKMILSVLIFVIVVYGILFLIVGLAVTGVIGGFKEEGKGNSTSTSGAVYVRWGRTTCPSVSEITYAGITGGKWSPDIGSGSNYLCLPEDPEYDVYNASVDTTNRGFVFSAEYEIFDFPPYADNHDHDAPCAVCHTTNRGSVMMIPAKMTCPSRWTEEYHGYLMTASYNRDYSTEYICVDRNPEVVPRGVDDENGAHLYPVNAICQVGNLPCAPYIKGAELTCVVCSK